MSERVGVQPREVDPGLGRIYDMSLKVQKELVQRQKTAPLVIKAPKMEEYELGPQGLLGWYISQANRSEACLHDWTVWTHDIRSVSGKHRHQGGPVLFVIEGEGYTTMNGERYDWEEGDLVMIPMMPEQVEHQHFNTRTDGRSSKWLAFIWMPFFNTLGGEVVQRSVDREWAEKSGRSTYDDAAVAVEQVEQKPASA